MQRAGLGRQVRDANISEGAEVAWFARIPVGTMTRHAITV